jgi:hypothetical protein
MMRKNRYELLQFIAKQGDVGASTCGTGDMGPWLEKRGLIRRNEKQWFVLTDLGRQELTNEVNARFGLKGRTT